MDAEDTNVRTTAPFAQQSSPARGKAYLVVLSGGVTGQTFEIDRRMVIGRSDQVDLRLGDDMLSREHAVIFPTPDDEFIIQDLNSSNGTWVNGERIVEYSLRNGDRIQIGRAVWKFAFQDDLEAKLRDAQRMEAVGSLAAGIAHDFNNLLGIVSGGVSYLEDIIGEAGVDLPDASTMLADMGAAAERAAALTRQLLSFARHGELEQEPIDVTLVIEESVHLASRTFDRMIKIDTRIDADLRLLGDRSQIQQMMLNLCINARDAMPDGGTLTVRARATNLDTEQAALLGDVGAGAHIVLEVADTGVGMDDVTRSRAFEPFASTKGFGRGLGLATVYGIVRGHSGTIEIDSELGEGACFRIYLPALTMSDVELLPPPPPPPVAVAPAHTVRKAGVVLLVDDESAVRSVASRLLKRLGYTVVEACDGREAVAVYYLRQEEIDFVLMDLIMPEMSGAETYAQLRGMNPGVKVLVCSGFDGGQAREVLDSGAAGFLPKPYSLKLLREAIDRMFGP